MSASRAGRSILLSVSRSRRRVLVVMLYVFMFAYSGAFALGPYSWWMLIPILSAEILYLVAFSRIVYPINKQITTRKAADLDERQLTVRDRAHYHAYQILSVFLILIATLPVVAASFGGGSFSMSFTHWHWQALLLLCINLTISLPASVVAWMEPDPRPDE